jgi:lipopolysaccharide assembly outer membrane protein LptD (OstA)
LKKLWLFSYALFVVCVVGARGQLSGFGDVPIEISAESTYRDPVTHIAHADDNVVIGYGEIRIYCDHAQYNDETRDVLVEGNVRIFRDGRLFVGERAIYNLETKVLNAAVIRGDVAPFRFQGQSLGTLGPKAYLVKDGLFTTSDNSKPDYSIRARTIRIYPDDRIVFTNVRLYVGQTPIFWFPYLHQSLEKEQAFTITPGYNSTWGAYLLGTYNFPIAENWDGKVRLDLMSERGVGVGLESTWGGRRNENNWGRFRAYAIDDANPGINKTSLEREPIDPGRFRVSFQDKTHLTEDLYFTADINRLSDARFLQDFEGGEFRRNPNPDNAIALTKWNENYAATLIARENLNEDNFDATERLPEGSIEGKRAPIFKGPLFWENVTSAGFMKRNFADDSMLADYDTFRADIFHQLTLPHTFGGWLSFIPRVGVRMTYYGDTGTYQDEVINGQTQTVLHNGGSVFRPVLNAGFESSFKVSRAFEGVQSRKLGLDGLRHVVQPYVNFSYAYSGEDPADILQFDRLNPSTEIPPLDFPQFNSVDTIDSWTILRLGVRNRFQTRRDNRTINWLELDSFVDVNFDRPEFGGSILDDANTFSNVINRLRWNPVPWVFMTVDSQLPLLDSGFTQFNTSLGLLVNSNIQLNIGHRYISDNRFFEDSSLLNFGGYFRLSDNWGFSFRELYEFQDNTLETQRYELHRDLSSWIASLGFVVRDNRGVNDYGLVLTFTLKDIPGVRLPVSLDPEDITGGSGKNR